MGHHLDARAQILDLSRLLGASVGTTLLAGGLFHGDPAALGVIGTLATAHAADHVAQADSLLVLGAGLNRYTTVDDGLLSRTTVIQVDRDHCRLRGEPEVDLALVGDVGATVNALLEVLKEAGHQPAGTSPRRPEEALGPPAPEPLHAPLDPHAMMAWLVEHLPADRVVVTDTGRFAYAAWRLLQAGRPTDFTHTCNFASIGLGLGTAIGAALASGRLTVAVVGDGGGIMNLLELAVAVRLSLPLLVVVCNDGAYGMEYHKLLAEGRDPRASLLELPDFAAVARSVGSRATTVSTRGDLDGLPELGQLDRPWLLDVRCDPAV